jgi:hypothetical protein
MSLAGVLDAIESAGRPLTPAELAAATGVPQPTILSLLDALRANGLLAPEAEADGPPAGCAVGGSCGGACPGPGDCPLVIDLDLGSLGSRRTR